ncbi:MAG: hypothetical protein JWO38_7293 [Gemmataceae bacterium]|nr:hypothetical protein [Gemmataceae bacterium]
MSYQVTCECGKSHAVTPADAGATLACGCGRTVEVPPLHQLRQAAGQEVLSPVIKLRALLLDRRLPGTRRCALCDCETDGLAQVTIQCEWAIITGGKVTKGEAATGCLLFFLGGWLASVIYLFARSQREPKQHGDDVAITVPVRICEACRADLATEAGLRQALRQTLEYAELLDQYPKAHITLRG